MNEHNDSQPKSPDTPTPVGREEYFIQAGEMLSTRWSELAADDVLSEAWLRGHLKMIVDKEGLTFVFEDAREVEPVDFGGYL